MKNPVLGLRTVIYQVADIDAAKDSNTKVFLTEPYFNEPYYVGFNIGGYELGLQPEETIATEKAASVIAYWGVEDINLEFNRFVEAGASEYEQPNNVGGAIMVATVKDPWGNLIGLIYNPDFKLVS